jgi:hypothetical protein
MRISMRIILLPFYCVCNRLDNRKSIERGIEKACFFYQKQSLKARHPAGVVGAPVGTHRPPGERPVCLSGFRLASRASTLFCLIRPERANRQNSPARASGEAGPPRFLPLRYASVRDFVSSSAASWRNQGGPVSPDARAATALRMLRTFTTPWTGFVKADRTNRPGGHLSSPPSWARGASVLFALYRVLHRCALRDARRALPVAAIKSSQRLEVVGASLRVGRGNNRLRPIASSINRLRPIDRAPHPATTLPLDDKAVQALPLRAAAPVFAKSSHQLLAVGASLWVGRSHHRLRPLSATVGRAKHAPCAGRSCRTVSGRFSPCACVAFAQPSAGSACTLRTQSRFDWAGQSRALPLPCFAAGSARSGFSSLQLAIRICVQRCVGCALLAVCRSVANFFVSLNRQSATSRIAVGEHDSRLSVFAFVWSK